MYDNDYKMVLFSCLFDIHNYTVIFISNTFVMFISSYKSQYSKIQSKILYYLFNTLIQQPKCCQYWPEDEDDCITCDKISVTLLRETVLADYTVRKLVLKMVATIHCL